MGVVVQGHAIAISAQYTLDTAARAAAEQKKETISSRHGAK